ncbi:hypothetical protein OIO90_006255, partial [Microbotryomycetes sp. JL221]
MNKSTEKIPSSDKGKFSIQDYLIDKQSLTEDQYQTLRPRPLPLFIAFTLRDKAAPSFKDLEEDPKTVIRNR